MASSSSSIPNMASSSSISGSNPPKYDVFLSFRGKDTRKSFRSHLDDALKRSGLVTFFDDRDLETGDKISSSLSDAIRSSSLSIIIFSQNYASSSWCLDELLEILACYETREQIILPIFYHVSPSDVRYQNGTYREAFAKHERRFKGMQDKVPKWRAALTRLTRVAELVGLGLKPDDEQKQNGTYGEAFAKDEEQFKDTRDKVQKWRAALAQVAGLSGLELMPDDKQLETEFIEEIVKDVLAKLNRISSGDHLDPGLVGIKSRVETVESLLCLESTDFCTVGIWGMGGIGKTTIARVVYNRIANKFKAVCFLENVRNDAQNGPNHLQKKLLSEILGEGNHIMNDFTRRRLGGMKILIVIDDVDNSRHLTDLVGNLSCCFGPGSRIIVTSRDRQVLKTVVDEFKLYEVERLNYVEAPQLFSLNAFKQSHSPEDRMELSSKFVHYAKGNPLALKVLGCSLFEKGMEEWESSLDNLRKSPDLDILDVLSVSYDRLDYPGKEIFLFIACFFKGEERDRVTTILNGCGFSALAVISGLVDKCLVTITFGNRLSMHDLIQKMGRYVVFKESKKKPGGRSRLWDPQEICDLFKKNTGTEAVESISLDLSQISDRELYISPDAFTRMPNLKLLKFYFSTSDYLRFHKRRIGSDDWRYNEWRKEMNKVKIICERLESLPDELRYLCWHGYPWESLPKFNPEHLVDLEMPHSKLQYLRKDIKSSGKKLRRIDLSGCTQLTEVPDPSQATNLESMELDFCSSLTQFPKISSNVMLTRLCLTGTAIEEVPNSAIKCLSTIVSLDFSHNTRLRKLPNMRHLTSLKMLYLDGCSKITKFPKISGAIAYLGLCRTAIEEVPDSAIQSLSKIVSLNISYNKRLRKLPSMRHLTSLASLDLDFCSNITEFPDISKEITRLHLSGTGIEEVPSFVGCLTNLRSLELYHCQRLKYVSSSIFQLKLIDRLYLYGCSKLENFPEVLENEGMLPNSLRNQTNLSDLDSNVIRSVYLRGCKDLMSLPSSLCNLGSLSNLYLSGCPGVKETLEKVLLLSPSGLRSLKSLDLSECNMEVLPPALSRIPYLNNLNLMGNEFESLSLELFTSLRELNISYCKRLRYLQDFPLPSRLHKLIASNCTSLETLPDTNGLSAANYSCFYYYHNCFKLDERARINIQEDARSRTQLMDSSSSCERLYDIPYEEGWSSFCFPGSEIPKWLSNQNEGSSIEIDLSPHWYSNKLKGFVVCIVASCESSDHIGYSYVKCECKIKDPDCDGQDITFNFPKTVTEHPKSDHVFIKSIMPRSVISDRNSKKGSSIPLTAGRFKTKISFWQKARFRFSTSKGCCKVKKCGINLVDSESEEEDCHSESEEEDCYSESEEEDCHSESEEEDYHSEREDQVFETVMMSPQRKKRKIAT